MAFYVPPDGIVKLLVGVPLDIEHEHSLYFPDINTQTNYFLGKAKHTATKVSYVRKGRGVIKLQVTADNVYDCNYLMYQNNGFSNKWFYGFITSVEYISNTVTQITFVIDQLQTWFFDMQLAQSFVEREHANHDIAGDNLIPEGLETGDYMYNDGDFEWCHNWTVYDVLVLTTFVSSWIPGTNQWVFSIGTAASLDSGVVTGLNKRMFRNIRNQATFDQFTSFLNAVTSDGKQDGIVAIIMIPHEVYDEQMNFNTVINHYVPKISSVGNYTPRNKKLLTYPYVFIEAQNCEGATAIFKQEYFSADPEYPNFLHFIIEYTISAMPIAGCTPIAYKNSVINRAESMYINNFVICSWNIDLFKAYMAQSLTMKIGDKMLDSIAPSVNTAVSDASHVWNNLLGPLLTGDMSTTSPYEQKTVIPQNALTELASENRQSNSFYGVAAAVGAGSVIANAMANSIPDYAPIEKAKMQARGGALSEIYNALKEAYPKMIAPPHNNGTNAPDFFTGRNEKGFWFFHRFIRPEFAAKIDSYFDRFGYATNETKIPNIHVRQNWTYTKTRDCQLNGDIPVEAKSEIKQMFNSGITFWTNPANVGNYSLSNNII